jgi:hypothetical protein
VYNKTTIDKIYSEVHDNISECYTDIINNSGLNIYVNDRVVSPEKDYSEEPQCKPFNKNMKIIKYVDEEDDTNEEYICEDDEKNYYRFNKDTQNWNLIKTKKDLIMFGLESGKKIKSKNDENWVVDRTVSYSDKEIECMRFKGIFMMYHPDLNTDSNVINESRYPKGRIRLYRRGRCHGDWNLEKANGSVNFTDIRVDYKSKKIGNDLGITWNKDISGDQDNDLCIAVKALIKKIKSELVGDTADSRNKTLYNIALKNKIHVPERRLPTDVKKVQQPFIHGGVHSQIQEPKIIKELPKKVEPNPTVLDCLSNIPKVNKPFIISDEDNHDITLDTKVPTIVVPHVEAKVPAIVVPHVEAKVPAIVVPHVEAKVPANIELVMEEINNDNPATTKIETNSDVIPENNIIKPQMTNISESVQTTITIKEGKKILNSLKNHCDINSYSEDIIKIIILYCDRCAKDQILLALKYMTISNKLEFLAEMIFLKYRFCNDDKTEILGGSKLNTIFRNLEKK